MGATFVYFQSSSSVAGKPRSSKRSNAPSRKRASHDGPPAREENSRKVSPYKLCSLIACDIVQAFSNQLSAVSFYYPCLIEVSAQSLNAQIKRSAYKRSSADG